MTDRNIAAMFIVDTVCPLVLNVVSISVPIIGSLPVLLGGETVLVEVMGVGIDVFPGLPEEEVLVGPILKQSSAYIVMQWL